MSSRATSLRRSGLAVLRRRLGQASALEVRARSVANVIRFHTRRHIGRRDFYAFRNGAGARFGVYGLGACDLDTLVKAGPGLARMVDGVGCIVRTGTAARARSDLLVQTLTPPPAAHTAEVISQLKLDPGYFSPRLLEPDFTVADQAGLGRFPKSVVVLSISADTARTLYRHRQHGFLVDPGGWWLTTDMGAVLQGKSVLHWFNSTFEKAGRISVEESMHNYETLIATVRQRLGSFVVMLNVLTVDPGLTAVDYNLSNSPHRIRRREFVLALNDLGRRLEFPVIDADRLTKQEGISGQADFVHYTREQMRVIADEFLSVLRHHEVVGT